MKYDVTAIISPWQAGNCKPLNVSNFSASPNPQIDQTRQNEEDILEIGLGQVAYIPERWAVVAPVVLKNRADRPNNIVDVRLLVGDKSYCASPGPQDLRVQGMAWLPPDNLQLGAWGSSTGVWWFGPSFGASREHIELEGKTSATLRINTVRGEPKEIPIEITPLKSAPEN